MATQKNQTTTAKKKDAPATDGSYGERAAELAADTRALAEQLRGRLADHLTRVEELQQTEPTVAEVPAADAVRRLPMAAEDVTRALEGLVAAAADLTQRAGLINTESA